MERVVVTGASRGLGLEFCRQYLRAGYAVIAVVRREEVTELETLKTIWPDRFHTRALDVTDEAGVRRFGAEMAEFAVSVLVNNAGQIGPETHKGEPGQNVDTLDLALCRNLFEVNALAPLVMTLALLPSLAMSGRGRSVVMGSTIGCARETFGDYYGYRMSKAAAHVAFATLGKDLVSRGAVCATVCPGWVKTDLGGPAATLEPHESVEGMIRVIDGLGPEQAGGFIAFDGSPIAY